MREVLESLPLYKSAEIEIPTEPSGLWPSRIELDCPTCRMSRPFQDTSARGAGVGQKRYATESMVYGCAYGCTGCTSSLARFYVAVDVESGRVRKVGQWPAWSRKIPPELKSQLGEAFDNYQRALTCLGQAYGLGACAYLRRVLEDVITPLLKFEEQSMRSLGRESDAAALQAAISAHDFKSKTEAAYKHAPPSLIVDGHNPFKMMHDHFSVGVHRLSEDECVDVARGLATALEFVVCELNRHHDERKRFAETLGRAKLPPKDGV